MKKEILNKAKVWTASEFDEETRQEIQHLIDEGNEKELVDRFYKELEFGTGGMRGIMAAGSNRMNIYTVGRATQGLANYLLETYSDTPERGVSIAYDSRNNSKLFAREAARVLAANGIKVFIYPELRPTPLLSYTVRELCNRAGIVLTASHNPKEYNGYKVYGADGSQVISPEDVRIVAHVNGVDILHGVKWMEYSEGTARGLITELGPEIEHSYLEKVYAFTRSVEEGIQKELSASTRKIKVVYSPLHGAGITMVPKALEMVEGAVVLCEPEQSKPDGNFSTTPSPNPEETKALSRAIEYARREKADIYERSGHMPANPVIISTVVSTELAGEIARTFGVDIHYVLTGFKFIAARMREFEETGNHNFIFAFEESYGYLADTFVRDKDGVIASVLALLMVKYAAAVHGSVLAFLEHIYRKYGMYVEYMQSFTLKGAEGAEKIKELMKNLREDPPDRIAGSPMEMIKDYQTRKVKHLLTGKTEGITGLPVSNVLQFYTGDGVKVSARPSGTEPKIKFYFGFSMPMAGSMEETKRKLDDKYNRVSEELFKRCGLL
ncbi:MAG: hypothetical protein AMS17_20715 [Spirochaetes bacterium DG_61]|nr:MAG: hypothetical protein AMS17_20715 [Spirochaetes bacterium DG_61]